MVYVMEEEVGDDDDDGGWLLETGGSLSDRNSNPARAPTPAPSKALRETLSLLIHANPAPMPAPTRARIAIGGEFWTRVELGDAETVEGAVLWELYWRPLSFTCV
jgi:hypothetical protein